MPVHTTLPVKRIILLIKEIQETEEQFQDFIAMRHWIPSKKFKKQKDFFEGHLGMLYNELMRLVKECALWYVNVDKNTVNYTFWRDK